MEAIKLTSLLPSHILDEEIEMKRLIVLMLGLSALGIGLTGCSNTVEGAKEDTSKMGTTSADAGKDTTAATVVTPMVKNAIIADAQLNDSRNLIDVDSKDNVVHLKGHVISAELKTKAEQIATKVLKDNNKTDTVSNELEVKP